MLSNAETEKTGNGASPQATPSNPFKNNNNNSSSQNNSSFGSSSSSGSITSPDQLSDESGQAAPMSVTLGEIRLIGDNSSNSIIVFGPPESKQRTKQILELLDRRPKQVYLAVVIGQLRVDNNMDYGVSYLIKYQNFKPLQQLLGNSNTSGAAATVLSPGTLFPGTLPNPGSILNPASLTPALSSLSGLTIYGAIADSVDVYARFLESTNRFRTLSRPVIYTTNNRKATILSGQKVPVPTSTLTTATGGGINNQGSAVTSNIQYQDVVLKLEVIPLINSDREVNLLIVQKNDNIIGKQTISGNEVPLISTQEIKTSVRVPNGSTIVLGGLITEDKENNQEGIPYLSRVPVIGSLLGGRTNNIKKKNELIVMIQPVVVDSNPEMLKASAYEGERSPLGRDAQEMTAPLAEQARPAAPWKPVPTPTPKPKKKPFWSRNND
jgi:type II secretory pathway component GspD/PulD (secretin)